MALALATALSFMQLLKVPHPPAGSNPLIVFIASANWEFFINTNIIRSSSISYCCLIL
jgi:CBS-domain-containing membrane protein